MQWHPGGRLRIRPKRRPARTRFATRRASLHETPVALRATMMFSIRPRWLGGAQQASLCEGASGGAIDRSAAVATASSNAMTTIGNAQTRPGRIGGASPAAIEASEFRSETSSGLDGGPSCSAGGWGVAVPGRHCLRRAGGWGDELSRGVTRRPPCVARAARIYRIAPERWCRSRVSVSSVPR